MLKMRQKEAADLILLHWQEKVQNRNAFGRIDKLFAAPPPPGGVFIFAVFSFGLAGILSVAAKLEIYLIK